MACPVCGGPAPLIGIHAPPPIPGAVLGPTPVPLYGACSAGCAQKVWTGHAAPTQSSTAVQDRQRRSEAVFHENLDWIRDFGCRQSERRPDLFRERNHIWYPRRFLFGREYQATCTLSPAVPAGEHLWTVTRFGERDTARRSTGVTSAGTIVLMTDPGLIETPAPKGVRKSCRIDRHERWEAFRSDNVQLGDGMPVPPRSPYTSYPRIGPEFVVQDIVDALVAIAE